MKIPREQWRTARNRGLWYALRGGQRLGLDLTPHHFYSNSPDLRSLRRSTYWRRPRTMTGVKGAALTDQAQQLAKWVPPPLSEEIAAQDLHGDACVENGAVGYGRIEADLLYAFLATNNPARMIQIGSGVSTAVALKAKVRHGLATEITCVDPYPTEYLRTAANRGDIVLLPEPAQTVPLETFTELRAGDLLFIDSTHTVKVGSEVNLLVLDVLPSLTAGVFVHFHDIYLPYDYGRDVLDGELFFWNESVLLHAFLIGNERASIRVSCSMLHHGAPEYLCQAFPRYSPQRMTDGMPDPREAGGDYPSALYFQIL
ncbi:MAG: class I SAM-dependent methyltransferase [Actinomycetota bacterium]|nr:class I SAM-dependent methyltransferase [Actinomycetota bacterium]